MSTIQLMMNHNKILRNHTNKRNIRKLHKNIDDLPNYTQSNKKIIENIILNILNKKDIYSDEINILHHIIYKLSAEDMNVLKLSTLLLIIDKIYFIKRNDIESIVERLERIENKDIKNYLKIVQGKTPTSLNLENLRVGDLFKGDGEIIIELFGFIRIDDKVEALLYGQYEKKSFVDRIPLDVLIDYPKIEKNINNREKFNLFKATSGNSRIIETDDSTYKLKLDTKKDNPIIFTKLKKKTDGSYELTDELRPANKNNIKK